MIIDNRLDILLGGTAGNRFAKEVRYLKKPVLAALQVYVFLLCSIVKGDLEIYGRMSRFDSVRITRKWFSIYMNV